MILSIFSGNKNKIFHFDKIKKLSERDVRYNNNRLDIIHLYCCNKDIKIYKLFSVWGYFAHFAKGELMTLSKIELKKFILDLIVLVLEIKPFIELLDIVIASY